MKRFLCMAMLCAMLPAGAWAELELHMTNREQGNHTLTIFEAQEKADESAQKQDDEQSEVSQAAETANVQIETRFAQKKAEQLLSRAGASVQQSGELFTSGSLASMTLVWNGTQADGTNGSSTIGLVLDLTTGEAVELARLFDDADAAFAAMENIISDDVLSELSDYMEYGDLLPMPTDNYAIDEQGLTVFYPDDRYRYFDEKNGAVQFAWYELAAYIGEDSPVYALAHKEQSADELKAAVAEGRLPGAMESVSLGEKLGDVLARYTLLTDPDYTNDSRVYLFEEPELRGWAVEIPKYAETEEDETPISAIRTTRAELCGLTIGKTTRDEVIAMLGEAKETRVYDEDAARDRMLPAGESLFYELSGKILQAHIGEDGTLAGVILRGAMPEELY